MKFLLESRGLERSEIQGWVCLCYSEPQCLMGGLFGPCRWRMRELQIRPPWQVASSWLPVCVWEQVV